MCLSEPRRCQLSSGHRGRHTLRIVAEDADNNEIMTAVFWKSFKHRHKFTRWHRFPKKTIRWCKSADCDRIEYMDGDKRALVIKRV
jgi:hypothetical protein